MSNVAPFPAMRPEHDAVIPSWNEEHRLLAAIRGGDRSAAEELVDRTYSAVFASMFRLCGDHELASDLTQDTYRRAWEALPGFNGQSKFFTWLYRIGYTTFLNHLRRPRAMKSLDDDNMPETPDESPGADEILGNAEEAEHLREAVLRLPEDLRFTVTAHFWGGLEVKEIAAIEELTTAAIRKRLHKAFSLLEQVLGGNVEEERDNDPQPQS